MWRNSTERELSLYYIISCRRWLLLHGKEIELHYFNDIAHVYRGQRVYPYTLFCLYSGGDVAIETV